MKCSVCQKEMNISEGLTEFNGKRCHIECKKQYEKDWREEKGLDHKY